MESSLKDLEADLASLSSTASTKEKYEPPRDNPQYHPTATLKGHTRLPLYDVPDYNVKPKTVVELHTNLPDRVIKVNRCGPYPADMVSLCDWLEGYGGRIGKMLCLPESKYCMVLTYEKAVGSTLVKTHKVKRLTADVVNEVDRLANRKELVQTLYKNADGGKLTKIRITWLE